MARHALLSERALESKSSEPASAAQRARDWQEQREMARRCRACPLYVHATQTVWGEGPIDAPLMLVGEQPGDQEDLQGRPFVGPAGRLLDRALAELGWDRSVAYVTNAVKHFKWVPAPRGKRRMHKTPAQREADACEPWLEREIALVRPRALVALGATASRQLLKRPVAVLRERGHWIDRPDGLPVLVTLHPSALLRLRDDEFEVAYAAWLDDLRLAGPLAAAGR
jgi:DNA polymerase